MILFVIYVILSSLGLILFKLGSKDLTMGIHNHLFSMTISPTVLIGILCYLCSFLLWLLIVNKSQLSYIYPMSIAFINIAILVGSYFLLNEPITIRGIIGVAVIVLGIIIMK